MVPVFCDASRHEQRCSSSSVLLPKVVSYGAQYARFTAAFPAVFPGMPADARIIVAQHPGAFCPGIWTK